jgi:gliding motility-associated protein GldM
MSTELITWIETECKDVLIDKTGGYAEDKVTPLGMKNTDWPGTLFLGDNPSKGTPLGQDFERKLNEYIDKVNVIYDGVSMAVSKKHDEKHYPYLALKGTEDPNFMNNPEQKAKGFLELAFDHTPMIASLAFMTEKQSKIAAYEKEILAMIQKEVGASDFKFDEIVAMASADASTVAAGTWYEAQLFVTAKSSAATEEPEMFNGKQKLKVSGGIGKVRFKASYNGKPGKDGLVKKSWKGSVKMKNPTGEMETFDVNVPYYVSKPVIQVQSGSVSALYKNCGNELNIQVPALGSLYAPSFSVKGASKKDGGGKGEIIVIPTAPKVSITVASGGQTIGTEEFKVRLVPKPEIIAKAKGKPVDQKKGMKAPGPRSITMDAIADPSFKAFLPKDSRYRVTKWEAVLVRGKRPVETKKFSTPKGNLSSFAAKAKPNDRILIEVKEVMRKTYLGSMEKVKLGTIIMNVPLTD